MELDHRPKEIRMTDPGRERDSAFRGPAHHELLAMAYVDGELSDSARRSFRALMRREPVLMRHVAELTALGALLHKARPTRCTPRKRNPTRHPFDF